MQNGFVSNGGSYNKLGMNIENYQKTIPKIKELINFCRKENIPIFYTETIREPNGIELLINVHNILPITREEWLQNKNIPSCVRGRWDAQTIDEIKPTEEDYINFYQCFLITIINDTIAIIGIAIASIILTIIPKLYFPSGGRGNGFNILGGA